jgi:hypothetical protein
VNAAIDRDFDDHVERIRDFLRIPSVSMLDVSVRSQILHVLLELQRARAGAAVHHPRPEPRVAAVRPDRGHVPRADHRARRRARRDRARRPPVHAGARRRGSAAKGAHAARGELPDAAAIPTGCRFHPRCPQRFEPCDADDPPLFGAGEPGHEAAWLLLRTAAG